MQESISKLLGIANRTVYKWQQDGRPIISFLYAYFDKEDIDEYLKYQGMQKLDFINQSTPISVFEFQSLAGILGRVDTYIHANKANREAFLIKLYRTLRDYQEQNEDGEYVDFITFLKNYNMLTFEALRNVMWGSSLSDVIGFYEEYLSKQEQQILLNRKFYIMPTLKSMRKYNAHLKD